jgi:hypothetical protein
MQGGTVMDGRYNDGGGFEGTVVEKTNVSDNYLLG